MNEEHPKCNSGISVESDQSERRSLRSLHPTVPIQTESSTASLVEVTSIQKSESSGGLMNRVLGQIRNKQALKILGYVIHRDIENSSYSETKMKQQTNQRAPHVCGCSYKCLRGDCDCFKYEDEQCLNDFCCKTCVQAKKELLKPVTRGRGSAQFTLSLKEKVNNTPSKQKNIVFCQCFKINCLKKYCSCFAAGLKCNSKCRCQQCDNWQQESPHYNQPHLQIDSNLQQMPSEMDFEPPNF